ncbi:hypothetical protein GCM10020331_089650 [Ectobacillus funiculus]
MERPVVNETTALGAAYLAGLAVGYWNSQEELTAQWNREHCFEPHMEKKEQSEQLYAGWKKSNFSQQRLSNKCKL